MKILVDIESKHHLENKTIARGICVGKISVIAALDIIPKSGKFYNAIVAAY